MPDLPHWTLFLTATAVLLLIPGPAVLFVISRGVDQGFRAALCSSVGLALGNLLQVLCAALGLSALLSASIVLFGVVKYAGATYLIVIGIQRILEKDCPRISDARSAEIVHGRMTTSLLIRQGFLVNALNPKTALFFLALLPQFITQTARPASLQILAFGGAFVTLGFITNNIYGMLGGKLGRLAKRSARFRRTTRCVGGGTLIALGVAAAFAPGDQNGVHVTR